MSGVEIAGLVLGAFPLLCQAGKQVGQTCKHFKTLWRFEREFEKFLWAVEREQIAFSQNLEIFLAPLEDLSAHERELLQGGLHSDLWHLPRIQQELRQGVQEGYYEWFIRQLVDINDALTQLHQLLPIVRSSPDTKTLESHIYRLRHSFFPRKDELLALIAEKNENIYLFFSRASLRPSRPPRPDKRKVKSFLELQQQALTLHETLRSSWSCSCDGSDRHSYTITTQRLGRHSFKDVPHIGILSINAPTQLRVEVVAIPETKEALSQAPTTKQSEITALRQELTLRTRLKELREKSSKGISVL
ncbi:hypothetical protein QBC37DRAFT_136589 [Rhypophila decipiens]|uniref:Uncharacterized protein n=1 Tax=Rhypophila decipiens TaxID=261697 RepID=A0AAN6YKK4_9PEZI|nr:hypothetical protein QBC37DRAFT_136589 [Rhypophila decipiens]